MKVAFLSLWNSLIRTYVPYIVAWVVAQMINLGVQPDPEFEFLLGSALTLILGSAYHLAVRLLETYVSPKFGFLIGSTKQPVAYAKMDAKGAAVITNLETTRTGEVKSITVETDPHPIL